MNDNEYKKIEEEFESYMMDYHESVKSVKPSEERLQQRIDKAIKLHRELYGEEKSKRTIIYTFSKYYDRFRYSPSFKPALAIACTIIVIVGIYFIGLKKGYEPTSPDVATKIKQNVSDGEIDKIKSDISKNQIVSEKVYKIQLKQRSFGIAQTQKPDSVVLSFNKLSELSLSLDTSNQKQYISDWIRLAGDSLNGNKQSRIVFLLDSSSIRVCFEKQSLSKDSNTLKKIDKNKIMKYFNKLRNKK